MLFSFCVAFERYIITKRITQIPIAILAKNQRCQPPLSAEEAKSRAVVTRIMQIKRREQPYRIPRAKFWRIRYLLPKSIISTTTTSHSQRSPVEQSGLLIRQFTLFAITGDVADTASADICMFRHLADISSVVPAARTLITLGTRYHCLNCRITSIVLNIFIINTPACSEITNWEVMKINLTSSPNSFSFLIVPLASSAYFSVTFASVFDLMPLAF